MPSISSFHFIHFHSNLHQAAAAADKPSKSWNFLSQQQRNSLLDSKSLITINTNEKLSGFLFACLVWLTGSFGVLCQGSKSERNGRNCGGELKMKTIGHRHLIFVREEQRPKPSEIIGSWFNSSSVVVVVVASKLWRNELGVFARCCSKLLIINNHPLFGWLMINIY